MSETFSSKPLTLDLDLCMCRNFFTHIFGKHAERIFRTYYSAHFEAALISQHSKLCSSSSSLNFLSVGLNLMQDKEQINVLSIVCNCSASSNLFWLQDWLLFTLYILTQHAINMSCRQCNILDSHMTQLDLIVTHLSAVICETMWQSSRKTPTCQNQNIPIHHNRKQRSQRVVSVFLWSLF